MSGLDEAGVVGLALFPEACATRSASRSRCSARRTTPGRRSARRPRRRPRRCSRRSARRRTTRSRTRDPRRAGVRVQPGPPGTATGNVTFYPKVNSLVISRASRRPRRRPARGPRAGGVADTRVGDRRDPGDAERARPSASGRPARAGERAESPRSSGRSSPSPPSSSATADEGDHRGDPRPEAGDRGHGDRPPGCGQQATAPARGRRALPARRRVPLRGHRRAAARGRGDPPGQDRREPRPDHEDAQGRHVLLEAAGAEPGGKRRGLRAVRDRRRPADLGYPAGEPDVYRFGSCRTATSSSRS